MYMFQSFNLMDSVEKYVDLWWLWWILTEQGNLDWKNLHFCGQAFFVGRYDTQIYYLLEMLTSYSILIDICVHDQSVFKIYDEDNSGNLNSFELRKALNSSGYMINNRVLEALVLRYGDDNRCIAFEDFIMCSVKLKAMIGKILTIPFV